MTNCNDCKHKPTTPATVPYIVHESALARGERNAKRITTALIISIILLVVSNFGWLWYLSLYDFTSYDTSYDYAYTQDGEGINIIGEGNEAATYGSETSN